MTKKPPYPNFKSLEFYNVLLSDAQDCWDCDFDPKITNSFYIDLRLAGYSHEQAKKIRLSPRFGEMKNYALQVLYIHDAKKKQAWIEKTLVECQIEYP